MKKCTLIKWTFALVAALFAVIPANAAVESVADLFGTYKFTSTMTVTEAGQSFKDYFKGECEVVITADSYNIYDGEIQGLAGSTLDFQKINGIDTAKKTIKITNPNGNGLWEGGLYMSNAEGIYPFSGNYSGIEYTYDDATKTITLPDFTLVTCDHSVPSATIIASFKDVKLTLVSEENIEVVDLSGDWHFTAGKGAYDVMENSTLPTEFDMTLTATDETKKNYSISMKLGDFAPLALTATFDGMKLTIPFNETYFDAENKIGLVNMYGEVRPGTVEFNLVNETTLSLYSGMTIAQDSISEENKGQYLQWYMSGTAKKQGGETAAVTWDGVYKVKVGNPMPVLTQYEVPAEFEMEVQYFQDWGIYLVTKFMDNDVTALNYGGIRFTPSADDPNKAEIATNALLKSLVAGTEYLALLDMNFGTSPLVITRQEDGTYKLDDFCVAYATFDASNNQNNTLATFCQNVTATKQEAVVEPEPFNWANTYTVNAGNITVYNNAYTYPNNFEMVVEYNEQWQMYLITKFFGVDVTGLNYGGITLTPSTENPRSATIDTNAFLSTIEPGALYFKMFDMNAGTTPLTVTVNEDGTLSIDDFCVSVFDWNTNQATAAALYSNVVATSGAAVEPEPQPEPYNWVNTYTVKAGNITVYNNAYTYPNNFEMVVEYNDAWQLYLVTKFFGVDVTGLNYGGITLTPSTENPRSATIDTNAFLSTIEPGALYFKMFDMNAGTTPLTVTVNEDGTLSIDDFCVSVFDWNTNQATAAALYSNVVATVGAMPEEIETEKVMLFYPEGVDAANEVELQAGYTMAITGNTSKTISSASNIVINGEKYKSIKLSNGAQNTLTLPAGKVATKITFYSYVNKDAQTDRPAFWKEVGGVSYDKETSGGELMCFKDLENPDVRSYTFDTPLNAITFTNTGEQLCFVMELEVGESTGIEDVTTKPVVNVNAPVYNLSGQRVSKNFKGIVIMNGKKYLVK